MSLDRINTITIEMVDALSAGDVQLFNDLLSERQHFLSTLTKTDQSAAAAETLKTIREAEAKIDSLLANLMQHNEKSMKRVLILQDAATEYTLSSPKRAILRDGLSG